MSKRVYKFTNAQFGISNLRYHRLKLSTIDDLNDPFDLASLDTTDHRIERALEKLVIHFRQKVGLLCFSRNWDSLLLWSNYGASHTGICCGFDIADGAPGANYDTDVLYQPNLLQILRPEDVNVELASRLLRTKHESWSYEQEVRLFLGLNDPPDANGLRWADFAPELELKEVIIGAQCSPRDSAAVTDVLKAYGESVKCVWAGMRKDAFLLVRQDRRPDWHSSLSVTANKRTLLPIAEAA